MSDQVSNSMESSLSFSFACGGWLKMYLFGVAKALQKFELEKNARLIGCSAGALTATGLALNCDFDAIRDHVLYRIAPQAHASLASYFRVRTYLRDTLARHCCTHLFETLNESQRLTIVYTSLTSLKSRRVTTFDSAEHLTETLLASCCAPPIAGLPFKLDGEWVMDGGMLDFQPVLDDKTVTISPFYCVGADIKPSVYVPMWWALFPPGVRDVEWLYDLGYEDGLRWIVKNGLTGGHKNVVIPNKSTKYAGGWNTTVGRVVGYRGFESHFLDALFIGLFVCLWRPMAFMCLYLELYLQAIVTGGKAVVFGAAAKLLITNVFMTSLALALATLGLQHTMLFLFGLAVTGFFLGGMVLLVGGLQQASAVASADWQRCRSYMRSITSLSLFLHSIPLIGPKVQVKRHDFLLKNSLVYRVAMHFV
ncbi:patatinlike phospholipase [Plasmopara halstedii]|uniref:Patatinlike phospholipase n=1 Tax=Plasmopara halstedii TaxID=4781 RepID=A0A0N7L7V6_PLAHL|nr:patatinlike phospholipase [Plasmopara halstedii]CEG48139.1 patatinlike phospholipase [Plasmopara halstedii]|eukprot:XP_024584508.1 patatinlike phospholipase [Plasmopara halstedii]